MSDAQDAGNTLKPPGNPYKVSKWCSFKQNCFHQNFLVLLFSFPVGVTPDFWFLDPDPFDQICVCLVRARITLTCAFYMCSVLARSTLQINGEHSNLPDGNSRPCLIPISTLPAFSSNCAGVFFPSCMWKNKCFQIFVLFA